MHLYPKAIVQLQILDKSFLTKVEKLIQVGWCNGQKDTSQLISYIKKYARYKFKHKDLEYKNLCIVFEKENKKKVNWLNYRLNELFNAIEQYKDWQFVNSHSDVYNFIKLQRLHLNNDWNQLITIYKKQSLDTSKFNTSDSLQLFYKYQLQLILSDHKDYSTLDHMNINTTLLNLYDFFCKQIIDLQLEFCNRNPSQEVSIDIHKALSLTKIAEESTFYNHCIFLYDLLKLKSFTNVEYKKVNEFLDAITKCEVDFPLKYLSYILNLCVRAINTSNIQFAHIYIRCFDYLYINQYFETKANLTFIRYKTYISLLMWNNENKRALILFERYKVYFVTNQDITFLNIEVLIAAKQLKKAWHQIQYLHEERKSIKSEIVYIKYYYMKYIVTNDINYIRLINVKLDSIEKILKAGKSKETKPYHLFVYCLRLLIQFKSSSLKQIKQLLLNNIKVSERLWLDFIIHKKA